MEEEARQKKEAPLHKASGVIEIQVEMTYVKRITLKKRKDEHLLSKARAKS